MLKKQNKIRATFTLSPESDAKLRFLSDISGLKMSTLVERLIKYADNEEEMLQFIDFLQMQKVFS
jgi:hypothetical protein